MGVLTQAPRPLLLKACEVSRDLIFVCNRLHQASATMGNNVMTTYISKKNMSKIEIDIIESADSDTSYWEK